MFGLMHPVTINMINQSNRLNRERLAKKDRQDTLKKIKVMVVMAKIKQKVRIKNATKRLCK